MSEASGETLLLNVTATSKKKKKPKEDNQYVVGNRFEVTKQSKWKPLSNNKGDFNKKNFGNLQGAKSRQKQEITSSLFVNNPEIPHVQHGDVKEINEPVFSKMLFDKMGIHEFMVSNLKQSFNITTTTTVQALSIPELLSGKDALIQSQTGSGKTLAYAIPIIDSLQKVRPKLTRGDGIKALIVLPTRELALQTYECFVKLVKSFMWLVPCLLVGGEKRKSEKARLRKGVNILIGTPGRLLDHIQNTKSVCLKTVEWFVVDEADRLLDMGYEQDVARLISYLDPQNDENEDATYAERVERQTVLVSATLSPKVEQLAGLALKNPVRIDASSKSDATDEVEHLVIPNSLVQYYVIAPPKLRLVTLAGIIHWKCQVTEGGGKMLIFMSTQDMVDFHFNLLSTVMKGSTKYFKLHGNMTQNERREIFKTFRLADSGVLLCTDVASRGLDLPSVDWIVQFTVPTTVADYVHRVGRTARVGLKGSAILFLAPSEVEFLKMLEEKSIKLNVETVDNCLENLQLLDIEGAEDIQMSKRGGPTAQASATALQLQFESAVLQQKGLHEMAANGFISWVRFYSTYPKEFRTVFNFQDLHLGHYAKSFALKDPPKAISGIGKRHFRKDDKRSRWEDDRPHATKHTLTSLQSVSEFDSGLKPRKKKKTSL